MYVYASSVQFTFAGLHAFRPTVMEFFVANSSTILEPSTAGSATTDYAGFLERATLGALYRFSDR